MSDIPNLSKNEYDRATQTIDKLNSESCPREKNDGRLHRAHFLMHLDGRNDYHWCETCKDKFIVKREVT